MVVVDVEVFVKKEKGEVELLVGVLLDVRLMVVVRVIVGVLEVVGDCVRLVAVSVCVPVTVRRNGDAETGPKNSLLYSISTASSL